MAVNKKELFDRYKNLLRDPNTMLSYDQNGQSQLLTCLMGCLDVKNADEINIKPYEFLLKLFFDSNIRIAFKRDHFTNVLEVFFVILPEKTSI